MSNDADVSALYHKEWDEASCPICMDHPHNAVLLICSSHDKGCRSYICDTSYRHSNCLDRFKQLKEEQHSDSFAEPSLIPTETHHHHHDSLNTSSRNLDLTAPSYISGNRRGSNESSSSSSSSHHARPNSRGREGSVWERLDNMETDMEKPERGLNLMCPLCRGTVLGFKVVEEARKYLNSKPRTCSHESCSFSGNYRELRRHARRVHPTIRPADVDPSRQRAWRNLENQREYNDIISAIHSAMPGAIVVGDYVIENDVRVSPGERNRSRDRGQWLSTLFLFQRTGLATDRRRVEFRSGRSRMFSRNRRARGDISRRPSLWGENLLGFQENNRRGYEDDGLNQNASNDLSDEDNSNRRRRRRIMHARSDENQR